MAYGILKPCYRCRYAKSYSAMLTVSNKRGPRTIVNLEGKTYVKHDECLGFIKCGKCFEAVVDSSKFPCRWVKL